VYANATTLGKLFTHTHTHTHTRASVTKRYNLVLVSGRRCRAAGEVTVVASHWPCVTGFSGISIYGLTAGKKDEHPPPTLLTRHGTLYLALRGAISTEMAAGNAASRPTGMQM